jgi:hypothetical protein
MFALELKAGARARGFQSNAMTAISALSTIALALLADALLIRFRSHIAMITSRARRTTARLVSAVRTRRFLVMTAWNARVMGAMLALAIASTPPKSARRATTIAR